MFQRGQFALRGGIIDVFSWHALHPVRIELFDDEIESIREFDVDAQTSIGRVDSCEILLSEANLELSGRISDYLGEGYLIIAVDCDSEFAHIRVSSGLTEEVSGRRLCLGRLFSTGPGFTIRWGSSGRGISSCRRRGGRSFPVRSRRGGRISGRC